MNIAVYLSIYAGFILFVGGCVWRIRDYARLPFHLRWELYPVPHEEPRRAEHGGSYFESGDWWLSPQTVHHRGDWLAMFREVVFLKGLWEFNRALWLPSFLFHFGLYLSIVALGCGLLGSASAVVPAGGILGAMAAVFAIACRAAGLAGLVLVLVGAALLLGGRMTNPALKNYTKAGDIFNLLFFLVAFGLLGAGLFVPTAPVEAVLSGALRFDRSLHVAPAAGMGVVLASALAAYIPFTHMSHFIAKYFTWHSVRWDDRRNLRDRALEGKVGASLQMRPTWAAAHMKADGKRTWGEIAGTNPVEEVRK